MEMCVCGVRYVGYVVCVVHVCVCCVCVLCVYVLCIAYVVRDVCMCICVGVHICAYVFKLHTCAQVYGWPMPQLIPTVKVAQLFIRGCMHQLEHWVHASA